MKSVPLASDLPGFDGWYRSSRLALLDFDVTIHSDDATVIELIEELYEPLQVSGSSEHVLMIGRAGGSDRSHFFVALDGRVIVRTPAASVAFAHLLFEANQQAIERTSTMVRLHAAAAVANGVAVVIPGAMGAGKSTLVAGLLTRGLGYVTDEVVALDPKSGLVRPYARPISLGVAPESLRPIGWSPPVGARRYLGASGVVPARSLGEPMTAPIPAGLVVLARYVTGAKTTMTNLLGVEGIAAVASHTFHLDAPGTLGALARLLAGVPICALVSGDLTEAMDAVLERAGDVVKVP